MKESFLWTLSRIVGIAAVVSVAWLIGYAIMDYGFATFLAIGVGLGVSLLVWAELLHRRTSAKVVPIICAVAGVLMTGFAVVGTFGLFAWNGFDPGTKPKAEAKPQSEPKSDAPAGTLRGGGLATIPGLPEPAAPPRRDERPAPAARPAAKAPVVPVPKEDAIPKAIEGLKSSEPAANQRALSALRGAPRDERAEEIAPLLEPFLAAENRFLMPALYAVKTWGDKRNVESLRKLNDLKNPSLVRLAKDALKVIESRP